MDITLKNDLAVLAQLHREVDSFAQAFALPAKVRHALDLSLVEAITNVISYAFPDRREHLIHLHLNCAENDIVAEITDDGQPFNPLDHPCPNISLPIEYRPVGGLGIHMIREAMDEMQYRRENDQNILTLHLKLK